MRKLKERIEMPCPAWETPPQNRAVQSPAFSDKSAFVWGSCGAATNRVTVAAVLTCLCTPTAIIVREIEILQNKKNHFISLSADRMAAGERIRR